MKEIINEQYDKEYDLEKNATIKSLELMYNKLLNSIQSSTLNYLTTIKFECIKGDKTQEFCTKIVSMEHYDDIVSEKYGDNVKNILQNEVIKENNEYKGIKIGYKKEYKRFVYLVDINKSMDSQLVIPLIDLEYLIRLFGEMNIPFSIDYNNDMLYWKVDSETYNTGKSEKGIKLS